MIVECTNCDTRFQLDDSRVPLRGIRVRCSRCKEAFFLAHPDAESEAAVHDVAAEAARDASHGPGMTQDFPDGTTSVGSGAGDSASDPEEEDWEFNADFPSEDSNESSESELRAGGDPFGSDEDMEAFGDDDGDDASGTVPGLGIDDLSDDGDDDMSSGLDLAGDDDPVDFAAAAVDESSGLDAADVDAALADLGSDDGAGDFGEATDFSALTEDAPSPPPAAPAAPAAAPAAAPPAQESSADDDWDFFSDDSLEQPTLGSQDDAMGRVMEAVEDPSKLTRKSSGPELGAAPAPRSEHNGIKQVASAIGWLVTLGLIGVGVVRGVLDSSTAHARVPTSAQLGTFQAVEVSGTWLETVRSTQLYAISGQLVNEGTSPRFAGRGLRVALVSPGGSAIEGAAVSAGAPISQARLRELRSGSLARLRLQRIEELAGTRVEPGAAVPFLAVFERVPDEATGFVLEMTREPPLAPVLAPVSGLEGEAGEALAQDGTIDPMGAGTPGAATTPSSGAPALPQQTARPR